MGNLKRIETEMSGPLENRGWMLSERTRTDLVYRLRTNPDQQLRITKQAFGVFTGKVVQTFTGISRLRDYLDEMPAV